MNRSGCGGHLAYWCTPIRDPKWISSGARAGKTVGIEVKAAHRWRRGDGTALKQLREEKHVRRALGVYLGREALRDGPIDVLPLLHFLRRLAAGDVLGVIELACAA